MTGHVGELELELEVRYGPQSPHDDRGLVLARKIDRESRVAEHLDIGDVAQHPARQVDAHLEREERRLVGVAAIATITLSKIPAARRTRSVCPLVRGSNVPG